MPHFLVHRYCKTDSITICSNNTKVLINYLSQIYGREKNDMSSVLYQQLTWHLLIRLEKVSSTSFYLSLQLICSSARQ